MSMHCQMHKLKGNCPYLNKFVKQRLNHPSSRDPQEKTLLGQEYTENEMFVMSITHYIPALLVPGVPLFAFCCTPAVLPWGYSLT